jgi:hypothetical protein
MYLVLYGEHDVAEDLAIDLGLEAQRVAVHLTQSNAEHLSCGKLLHRGT